jgi:O-antigen ligase
LPARAARWLPYVLAGVVVLYAAQASYSSDFAQGLQDVCFFYVPFMALFALLTRVRWSAPLLVAVFWVVIAEAAIFAAVAFVEYAVKDILWNPEVMTANLFHPVFRVNSLFWDPNILGRYLAVSCVGLTAVLLGTGSRRVALCCAAGALALIGAMALTFSQSAFIALIAGFAVLAALRWSARITLALGGLAALAMVGYLLIGGANLDFSLSREHFNAETSGRFQLIKGGLKLAGEHPVWGLGSGSFSNEFGERFGSEEAGATASHTDPVTVLAEQGIIGLAAYVAFVVVAMAALLAGMGPLAPGLRGFRAAPTRGPPAAGRDRVVLAMARAAILAAFVAMWVHSLSYAAFLTDPITWALLALGLALVRNPLSEA